MIKTANRLLPGIFISLVFLGLNLATLKNYSFSWDYFFHLNAGLSKLGVTPPHPTNLDDQPYGILTSVPGAASYRLFHQKTNLLPPDAAFNLPSVFASSLGIFAIYLVALETLGRSPAIVSAIFLSLFPRYIGHAHVNMKDPLSAALIALSIYFFYKSIKLSSSISNSKTSASENAGIPFVYFIVASAAFAALAFHAKINALLIPPILLLWLILSFRDKILVTQRFPLLRPFALFLSLSVIFTLTTSALIYPKPIAQITNTVKFFSRANTGYRLLFFGRLYRSNIDMPWYLPLGNLLAVTPGLILALSVIGFSKCVADTFLLKNRYSGLFLAWFLIPTLKYFSPQVGFADDFRHIMEALYPLIIFASIGFQSLLNLQKTIFKSLAWKLALLASTIYLLFQSIPLHPFEINYYSDLLGGLKGIQGQFDPETFALALKPALFTLNQIARENAVVYVPIASPVAQAYLRPDLALVGDFQTKFNNSPSLSTADYVVLINRPSLFPAYDADIPGFLSHRQPLWSLTRANTPLVWIFQNTL